MYARVELGRHDESDFLVAHDFRFEIPLCSIIKGITVEYEAKAGNTNKIVTYTLAVSSSLSGSGGDNKADDTFWPTSDTVFEGGGEDDLWGQTWTPAQINSSDFSVFFRADNYPSQTSDTYAYVNYIKVKITYEDLCPDPEVDDWQSLMDTRIWSRPKSSPPGQPFNWDVIGGDTWQVVPTAIPPQGSPNRSKNTIATCCHFSDFNLKLEFRCPNMRIDPNVPLGLWNLPWQNCGDALTGPRNWGNSGVKIFSHSDGYEIAILDSWNNDDTTVPDPGPLFLEFEPNSNPPDGCDIPTDQICGALYGHRAPTSNRVKQATTTAVVAVPDGAWNTMEIGFMSARFTAAGIKTRWATISVLVNGQNVQTHVGWSTGSDAYNLIDDDVYGQGWKKSSGPILLQEHDNPVQFKNVTLNPKWLPFNPPAWQSTWTGTGCT